MKLVAVSQRTVVIEEYDEVRDCLDQNVVKFLFSAGYLAIPIPNNPCHLEELLKRISPEAVFLSGGNNIHDSPIRDRTEAIMVEYARRESLPLLAICRGMQYLSYISGIGLHQVEGHAGTRHQVYGIINKKVNSFHDFAVDSCPDNFTVLARSSDGHIEAIRHDSLGWEAWMWHPERESQFDSYDILRVKQLFQ